MDATLTALRPLLAAEAAAEAAGTGLDAEDLEQALWVRVLERRRAGEGAATADWLRATARAEVRGARRRQRTEVAYRDRHPATAPRQSDVAATVLAAEQLAALRRAARGLHAPYPALVEALLDPADLSYREIAARLGIPQGSLGAIRSRCTALLRRRLAAAHPDEH
ncbi:sigma-70 family RNA polymerase sigma factor [Streptomyces polyrhachis]|uniref:Sigma-70 family RNA polymerase sigma factor n=1 Tax=Streptomyces polyrhachis TaxID=1282885 RepID=A0ABW2GEV5_9ACTN